MKYLKKIIEWGAPYLIVIIFSSPTCYFAGRLIQSIENDKCEFETQGKYFQQTLPLAKQVMRRYDTDNNGTLSSEEGLRMARALGIEDTFPSEHLI